MFKSKASRILILALIHFLVSLLALLAAMEGLAAFDDPDYQPSWRENAGDIVFECLMFPAIQLQDVLRGTDMRINDFLEWLLVIANSMAYACFADYIIFKCFGRKVHGDSISKNTSIHD